MPSTTVTSPQVAVNDIGSAEDFLAAIDATIKYFNDGDIVEGTIVKVDRDEVLLDIGYKTEGVIPSRELSIKHDVDPNEVVSVGDEVEALVLTKEDKEGRLILSKKRAQYERAWGTIEELKEKDEAVKGTVIEVVKGGLILDIGLRGFLPASLVEMRRVRDLQPYVGKEIEAKIIELDKNRNNVVLSRRAWLEQTQSEVRSEFLHQLQKGQVRKGVVSSIVNFGAFVDLGGVDGLVHVSELSWKHIDHPSEVVEVGNEVTVEVLDVDLDRERVSLSLKATQEDPWRQFARTHAIGQIVPGKVTKLVPFGAFVRVEEGIEGLVHISELAERHVEVPDQVVAVGDDAMVKVIDIDLERRRISLSLKQANEDYHAEFDPSKYGMADSYDEQGNYIFPEGFDPETNEWLEGFDKQREEWEAATPRPSVATRCTPRRWRRWRPTRPPRPRTAAAHDYSSEWRCGESDPPARPRPGRRRIACQRRPARRAAREAVRQRLIRESFEAPVRLDRGLGRSVVEHRVRPHGERPEAGDQRGGGVQSGPGGRELRQPGEVFEHDDVRAEQDGVRGTLAGVGGVVDVHRVDADEQRPGVGEELRGLAREERCRTAVGGRAPVSVPAGVQQHRPIRDVSPTQRVRSDAAVTVGRVVHQRDRHVGDRRQRDAGEVEAVGVAVVGAVEVGPGVADHRDAADLELRARGVV